MFPFARTLISIYSDFLYMALCVLTSEWVNDSVRHSQCKTTSTNEITASTYGPMKLPRPGGMRSSLNSRFLRREVDDLLQK